MDELRGTFFFFPKECDLEPRVPSKVSFFVWEASLGKIFTIDQLQRREWSMVNRCFLCKEEEESTDHILLHYAKVSVPWKLLFSLFGIQWVQAATVKEAFLEWHGPFVSKVV